MEDCIKRIINVIKNKNFFQQYYETLEVKEHQFIDSDIEFLKIKNSDPTNFYSNTLKSPRIIYCKHCGQITHRN